jgi:hypothetical protein
VITFFHVELFATNVTDTLPERLNARYLKLACFDIFGPAWQSPTKKDVSRFYCLLAPWTNPVID